MSEIKTFVQIVKEKGVHWDDFSEQHKFASTYIIEAAEAYKNQFPQEVSDEILGRGNPFPLEDVLYRLAEASLHLLKKKDYDGGDYEEIEICVKRAKEIINALQAHG